AKIQLLSEISCSLHFLTHILSRVQLCTPLLFKQKSSKIRQKYMNIDYDFCQIFEDFCPL
ncbi:MAG: hypothetical protein J5965_25330, partial [Aeriscardovia sp.]|nr:hypothetical protein [Aeriscardovia sp.]